MVISRVHFLPRLISRGHIEVPERIKHVSDQTSLPRLISRGHIEVFALRNVTVGRPAFRG